MVASGGRVDLVQELLLCKGLDPNIRMNGGMTALHCAAEMGTYDALMLL